jgi:P27 family predicted phage terminase small subunit
MRGRTPKPTKLKILDGQAEGMGDEPDPEICAPECPEHLVDEARAEWDRMVPLLTTLKMLTLIDRAALACYCQNWARWVEAEQSLAENGLIVKSPNGCPIQNPYLGVANTAQKHLKAFIVEFGLSPASRTRIRVGGEKPEDDLDSFINNPQGAAG